MMHFQIACDAIDGPRELHRVIATVLQFPRWYGNNLDALYDCLTDICEDTTVRFTNWEHLSSFAIGFRETFLDAAQENPCLRVLFS